MTKEVVLTGELEMSDKSRIIEMAWEDRTPFEAIKVQFGLREAQVIALMRAEMSLGSFKLWRARVSGRVTKHRARRPSEMNNLARHTACFGQPVRR